MLPKSTKEYQLQQTDQQQQVDSTKQSFKQQQIKSIKKQQIKDVSSLTNSYLQIDNQKKQQQITHKSSTQSFATTQHQNQPPTSSPSPIKTPPPTTTTTQLLNNNCIEFVNKLIDPYFKPIESTTTTTTKKEQQQQEIQPPSTQPPLQSSSSTENVCLNGHQQSPSSTKSSSFKMSKYYTQTLPITAWNLNTNTHKKLQKLIPFYYGLRNHGNTCYLNAIIQSISHTEKLIEYFLSNKSYNSHIQVNDQSNKFCLNRAYFQLFVSLWCNSYDSQYSIDLKQICGYLNKQFSGRDQNDSLEFCLWLLNHLNDEQTQYMKIKQTIIEHIYKARIKSTLVCSNCSFVSVKQESSLCLSLPLPQKTARSLYLNLILSNLNSIKINTTHHQNPSANSQQQQHQLLQSSANSQSKSKFYVDLSPTDEQQPPPPPSTSSCNQVDLYSLFHMRIGLHIPVYGTIGDVRQLISHNFNIKPTNIVFYEVKSYGIERCLLSGDPTRLLNEDICVLELNDCQTPSVQTPAPMINIVAVNITQQPLNNNSYQQQQQPTIERRRYGLPFTFSIQRDCTYEQLSHKLLYTQKKYLKEKLLNKYKQVTEQLFRIYLLLNDTSPNDTKQSLIEINAANELPLYIESIDHILDYNDNSSEFAKHIKLYIEWKPMSHIHTLFKDIDPFKADFVHNSIKQVQKYEYENESASLADCFELFTQTEMLSNENTWLCTKCKKQTNASKQLCISSLPPVLIVHLKRFYQSNTSNYKLTTPIKFPIKNLDIGKYVDLESETSEQQGTSNGVLNGYENNSTVYDLFSVVNHRGTLTNGHYTSYCQNPVDLKWYCFDDSNVNLIETNHVCTENAYILFYKRKNTITPNWWKNYVDERLFSSSEFLKLIERNNIETFRSSSNDVTMREHKRAKSAERLNRHSLKHDQRKSDYYYEGRDEDLCDRERDKSRYDDDDQLSNELESKLSINFYDSDNIPERITRKKQSANQSTTNSISSTSSINTAATAAASNAAPVQIPVTIEHSNNHEINGTDRVLVVNRIENNNTAVNQSQHNHQNLKSNAVYTGIIKLNEDNDELLFEYPRSFMEANRIYSNYDTTPVLKPEISPHSVLTNKLNQTKYINSISSTNGKPPTQSPITSPTNTNVHYTSFQPPQRLLQMQYPDHYRYKLSQQQQQQHPATVMRSNSAKTATSDFYSQQQSPTYLPQQSTLYYYTPTTQTTPINYNQTLIQNNRRPSNTYHRNNSTETSL